jgi:hypothetical protein
MKRHVAQGARYALSTREPDGSEVQPNHGRPGHPCVGPVAILNQAIGKPGLVQCRSRQDRTSKTAPLELDQRGGAAGQIDVFEAELAKRHLVLQTVLRGRRAVHLGRQPWLDGHPPARMVGASALTWATRHAAHSNASVVSDRHLWAAVVDPGRGVPAARRLVAFRLHTLESKYWLVYVAPWKDNVGMFG